MRPARGWLRPVFWTSDTLTRNTPFSPPIYTSGSNLTPASKELVLVFPQLSHVLLQPLLAQSWEWCGCGAWGLIVISRGCPLPHWAWGLSLLPPTDTEAACCQWSWPPCHPYGNHAQAFFSGKSSGWELCLLHMENYALLQIESIWLSPAKLWGLYLHCCYFTS